MKNFVLQALLFGGLGLCLVGCGGDNLPTMADLNNSNIRRVHSVYQIYMNNNQYRGPESKEELVNYVTNDNTGKALFKRMGLDPSDLEGIFVSERDGQPFKIKWGVAGIADHAIVFEAEGVEGKRLVAFSTPRELDTAEYDGYWSGDIKPEAPAGTGDIAPDKDLEQN